MSGSHARDGAVDRSTAVGAGLVAEETRRIADAMAVQLSRELSESENVFHGLASPLPAVACGIALRVHNPRILYLNIAGGVNAAPAALSVSTCSPEFVQNSRSFFSLTEIFDLSARGRLDTAFLGGVQVDRQGRINNSVIGSFAKPKVKLPGGAGSAAIVPTARRTIVWRTRHDSRSIVEHCDFVTAAGNVDTVITPLGVLRMEDGELRLCGWFPWTDPDAVRAATGFALTVGSGATMIPVPDEEEIAALRTVDPAGIRYSEFRS